MIAEDDAVREELAADGALFDGYHPRMEAVHRKNSARLGELIDQLSGWPGRSLAGSDGESAAWRIVQHAIGDPPFMRRCLPLLEAAARAGEADPGQVARLVDRLRVFEGHAQLYGTQYDWNDTGTAMVLMNGLEDDRATTEARRAAAGLGPLEETRPPSPGESPPRDRAAHRAAAELWAEKVGWRARPGKS